MSVKGLDSVVGKLKFQLDKAKISDTNLAVQELLVTGRTYAISYTPIAETSNLVNSAHEKLFHSDTGVSGAVYYEAYYAGYVNFAPGTLKGQPRAGVESFTAYKGTQKERVAFSSNSGNFWDPDAEPHFLEKGMQEMAVDAPLILKKHYAV